MDTAPLLTTRAVLLAIAFAVVSAIVIADPADAVPLPIGQVTLRSPQVPVSGSALQTFLNLTGESIVVGQDQFIGELLSSSVSNNSTYTIQFELTRDTTGAVVGLYNGHDATPTLMPVFPANATTGWFAVTSFRSPPTRGIVNVFDGNATLVGSSTYLGADRNAIGFYVSGPRGTFYSQDSRNPDGAAQLLFYRGTGLNTGSVWIAFEEQPLAESARDFNDHVLFVETIFGSLVPTLHSSWGQLKQRFR